MVPIIIVIIAVIVIIDAEEEDPPPGYQCSICVPLALAIGQWPMIQIQYGSPLVACAAPFGKY